MDHSGPKWTKVHPNGPKWIQNGPTWTQMDQKEPKNHQSGSQCTSVAQSGPESTRVDINEPNWTKMGKNVPWHTLLYKVYKVVIKFGIFSFIDIFSHLTPRYFPINLKRVWATIPLYRYCHPLFVFSPFFGVKLSENPWHTVMFKCRTGKKSHSHPIYINRGAQWSKLLITL